MVEIDGDEGNGHVDGDEEGDEAGEEAEEEEDAAEKLSEERQVAEPGGQAEGDDEDGEVIEAGEGVVAVEAARGDEFFVAVEGHGGADGKADEEQGPGLGFGQGAGEGHEMRVAAFWREANAKTRWCAKIAK